MNRKIFWNLRAIRLNTTPVVGKFLVVPSFLNSVTLCEFITTDWNNACKVLRSAIMREPCRDMSQKEFSMSFPQQKTKVGSQSFRRSHMSPIIHLCLFGKGYLKLKVNEIVLSKKRSAIIHIASLERMK